jgi:hypothetical protein
VSDDPSSISTVRLRWPADRRDQVVGATLVGLVVVLLGYASGIGAEGPGAQAAGGGPASTLGPPGTPTSDSSPVLVQAPPSSGGAQPTATGGYLGAVPPNQPSEAGPGGGIGTSIALSTTSAPGTTPTPPTTPAPPATPTPTGSQPPSSPTTPSSPSASPPTASGSQPTDPGGGTSSPAPGGPTSSSPGGSVLGGLLPPNLLPCLLDPLTAPLTGLLGLGGGLLGTCPAPTASAGGAP